MSIVGVGTDIVSVARMAELLKRHPQRFMARCFTELEQRQFAAKTEAALPAMVAGRWAAKEAFLKALGGSISQIPYGDISVQRGGNGGPLLSASGLAAVALSARGGLTVHLSISHEREYAVATAVIEG